MIDETREGFDAYLEQRRGQLGSAIHDLWTSRPQEVWSKDPYYYLRLGELADSLGQSMFAHDVLQEAVGLFPDHVRLTQLYSLSLIKCGFLLTARDLLTALADKGHQDEETLGILGRVYKEMWLIEGQGAREHPHLARSRDLYLEAFRRSRGHYSGINAASLSLIMGDAGRAERLAREVAGICAERWKDPAQRDYWIVATVAEANLVLGRQEQAAKYYGAARAKSGSNYANLASTRRQLRLLARYAPVDGLVLEALRIPPVVAFTGHMLDAPGRKSPRFVENAVDAVAARIAGLLDRLDVRIGYASAACGADVLFHECLQKRGGESNVILPFDRGEFFRTSVEFAGPAWVRRAEQVLAGSFGVEQVTRGGYGGEDLLFAYANQVILGKAILRSRFLETEPLLIAVWDGVASDAPGGTAECLQTWQENGLPYVVIDPASAEVREQPGAPAAPERERSEAPRARRKKGGKKAAASASVEPRRQTAAILFADLVGYSRLQEEQILYYIQGFLGTLAEAVHRSPYKPIYKNTWGDAVCFMFDDPLEAAECAMAMRDLVRDTDWTRWKLPAELNIRIGLHAGPVYRAREPLLERLNFFGSHVNQAARIEPITSPGNVYASEPFAALLLADPRNRLECKYVGVIVLPKEFGSYPIYHIKRKTEVG
jgi:class 3 adenylate cyclase/tetratricopeptide (TPR) repeat protein